MELTRSATDGESLGPEVLERIARAVAQGREEGRQAGLKEAENLCDDLAAEYGHVHLSKAAYEIGKLSKRGGTRDA